MTTFKYQRKFVERTARNPSGFWGKDFNRNPRNASYIISRLELTRSDILLDIGCGGGGLLERALETIERGVGIDHSPDMVALSNQRNREAVDGGRLDIRCLDIESTPWSWSDGTFSCVASSNVFMYIEHPEKVLSEIYRVLKRGGRIVIVTDSDCLSARIMSKLCYDFKLYQDSVMSSMLHNAGFAEIDVKSAWQFQKCYGRKL
jgi:SAM-dependent methyltransferase